MYKYFWGGGGGGNSRAPPLYEALGGGGLSNRQRLELTILPLHLHGDQGHAWGRGGVGGEGMNGLKQTGSVMAGYCSSIAKKHNDC